MTRVSQRDDFQSKIKTTLAQRVNYLCSNPACHEFTSGPHSDDNKPLILGVASHICAASPGGPRYDRRQTPQQRSSITNGVWLCLHHAREIDVDAHRFPAELLREWKLQTEQFVANGNPSPSLPRISLTTLSGLRLIPGRVITPDNVDKFRDHALVVENSARLDMREIVLKVQFPENLVEFATIESNPVGTSIVVQAPRITLETVPLAGPNGPGVPWNLGVANPNRLRQFNVIHVSISRLPALERVAITLVSPRPDNPPPVEEVFQNNSAKVYRYRIVGRFAFDWNREVRHLQTWSHLRFDPQTRSISSGTTLASHPSRQHVAIGGGLVG